MGRAATAATAAAAKITQAQNLINGSARGAGGRFVSPTATLAADAEAATSKVNGLKTATDAETMSVNNMNKGLGTAKVLLASFLVLGLIQFFVGAAKAATDFQSEMLLIQTQARAGAAEVRQMTTAVMDMAVSVRTGPEELAKGLYHIESVGMRGAKALDVLKTAALGARVGNADLEDVTNALVASVMSGIKGVEGMSEAMGTLNGIVGSGNMRMQDLADSLRSGVLATAKQFGLSIQDVGAALATMTDQGIPATEAATRMRITIAQLGAPTKAAAEQLSRIGLTSRALADEMRSPAGLIGALRMLKDHLDRAGLDATEQSQLLKAAFGGSRSSAGLLTLINSLDLMDQKMGIIKDSTQNFGAVAALQAETAAAKFQTFSAAVDVLSIALGNQLLPVLTGLAQILTLVAQQTGILVPIIMLLVVALGVKAVTAVAGFVGSMLNMVRTFLLARAATLGFAAAEAGATTASVGLTASLIPMLVVLGPLALAIGAVAAAYAILGGQLDAQADALTKQTTAFATSTNTTLEQLKTAKRGIEEQLKNAPTLMGWDVFGSKDKIQRQIDILDQEISTRMALTGKNADAQLAAGLAANAGDITDETKSLVELFGTSLEGVKKAAGAAGGAAMEEMAKGILDAQNAPLDALKTLHTMMKSELNKQAEITRLYAILQTANYVQGLKSGDPAVRAQALAVQKLVTERLDALTNGAYSAGEHATGNLAAGMSDTKAMTAIANALRKIAGPIGGFFDKITGTKAFSFVLDQIASGLDKQAATTAKAANTWNTQYKPAAADVDAALKRINQDLAAMDSKSKAAGASMKTAMADAKDAVRQSFDAVKTAARSYFDALHQGNLKAIQDAHDLANANRQGKVDRARDALSAKQDAEQLYQLTQAVAQATTPQDRAQAIIALSDFQAELQIKAQQKQVDIQNAAEDKKAALEKTAENKRYSAQISAFNKELAALERHLLRHPEEWRRSQVMVLSLLAKYGVNYIQAGELLGNKFATGLRNSTTAVQKAVHALLLAAAAAGGSVKVTVSVGPWPGGGSGGGSTPKPNPTVLPPGEGTYTNGVPNAPYVPPPPPGVQKYAMGTTRVPRTGMAMLHEDEAVLNPIQAAAYRQGKLGGSDNRSGGGTIIFQVGSEKLAELTDRSLHVQGNIYGQPVVHTGAQR